MSAVVAILAIVVAGSIPQARAVEVPDAGLATGPWIASGWGEGVAFISEGGLDLQMTVNIPAEWDFYVDVDGVVSGTWTHRGGAVIVGTTPDGQMRHDLNHSGSGSVGGHQQGADAPRNIPHNWRSDLLVGRSDVPSRQFFSHTEPAHGSRVNLL